MEILIRDNRDIYRHKIQAAIGEEGTVDDVLNYLLGGYDEHPDADFTIREWTKDTKTPTERANMFWALPLTLLCMPYQYIKRGNTGWDDQTRFGTWMLKVTGHLRDC